LRLFSFGGYGLALAAMALVVFGAYDSYPFEPFITSAGIQRRIRGSIALCLALSSRSAAKKPRFAHLSAASGCCRKVSDNRLGDDLGQAKF